jgi:hypothetical protein
LKTDEKEEKGEGEGVGTREERVMKKKGERGREHK